MLKTKITTIFTQYEIDTLNSPMASRQIEYIVLKIPKKKSPDPDGFTGEFFQIFKEKLTPILQSLSEKGRRHFLIHFMKPVLLISKLDRCNMKKITNQYPS